MSSLWRYRDGGVMYIGAMAVRQIAAPCQREKTHTKTKKAPSLWCLPFSWTSVSSKVSNKIQA